MLETILIVIIIAILGFTGWYVWHSKQNTDKVQQETIKTATRSTPQQPAPKVQTVALSDWKVEVPLAGVSTKYVATETNGAYAIKTEGIVKGCTGDPAQVLAGTITREQADAKVTAASGLDSKYVGQTWEQALSASQPSSSAVFGGYVYLFQTPQQACGNPATDAGKAANVAQVKTTVDFLTHFKQLRASTN